MKRLFILTLISFTLFACNTEKDDPTAHWDAQRLYDEAKIAMDGAEFDTAIKYLESLEARYPFGKYATQAQLDVIYAYYQYDEPASAIAAADRFIKLNPKHPNVDYAYYIKGLVNFNRGGTILDKLKERDIAKFDPVTMENAYRDLSELVTRFPNSRYAPDTRKRLLYLRNKLADSQIDIANYYLSRGAWAAAANRAKVVITKYQGSDVMLDALKIQLKAYQQLGFDDLVKDVKRVIDENYAS